MRPAADSLALAAPLAGNLTHPHPIHPILTPNLPCQVADLLRVLVLHQHTANFLLLQSQSRRFNLIDFIAATPRDVAPGLLTSLRLLTNCVKYLPQLLTTNLESIQHILNDALDVPVMRDNQACRTALGGALANLALLSKRQELANPAGLPNLLARCLKQFDDNELRQKVLLAAGTLLLSPARQATRESSLGSVLQSQLGSLDERGRAIGRHVLDMLK